MTLPVGLDGPVDSRGRRVLRQPALAPALAVLLTFFMTALPALADSPITPPIASGTVFAAWPTVSTDGRNAFFTLPFTQGVLDHPESFVLATGTMSTPPAGRPLVFTLPINAAGGVALPTAHANAPQPLRNPAVYGNQIYVDWDKKLLAAKLPAVQMTNVPLVDVISKLGVLSQTNLAMGLAGMKKAGIDYKMPVSLDCPAGTLRDALEELLEAPAKITPLVVTAEDNVVFIATQAQADHDVVTRAYYTQDLMGNISRFIPGGTNVAPPVPPTAPAAAALTTPPGTPAPPTPRAKAPPTLPGTNVALAPPAAKTATPPGTPPVAAPNAFLELITSHVRPEIWKVNGGAIGEIAEFSNRVTVTAPKSVHALLEGPKHYDPNAVPMYVGYTSK